jgi:hypothetical protein
MMTVLMNQEERNQLTAQLTLGHIEMIEKLAPKGVTVSRRLDHEITKCYGRAVAGSLQREYDLIAPMGLITIRGPFQDDLPEPQLRQHFTNELIRALK